MIRMAAAGAVAFTVFMAGYQVKAWMVKSELADALQEQAEVFIELDKERLLAGADLENQLAEARKNKEIRYVEKQKIINRPVYRKCKLDADGLRFINEQIDGANAAREHAYPVR
jgi:hypothetical protein